MTRKILIIALGVLCCILAWWIVSTPPKGFVTLKNNSFYVDGEPFHVMCINYKISLRSTDGKVWPTRFVAYEKNNEFINNDEASSLDVIEKDFQLAKEMGFNTVRVVGIAEPMIFGQKKNPNVYFIAYAGNNTWFDFDHTHSEAWAEYNKAVTAVLDAAAKAGLKVILTTKMLPGVPILNSMLEEMVVAHAHRREILAWDFLNEPMYFDSVPHNKEEVYYATRRWNEIVKSNSHHLTTIGLAGHREVFVWDPNLVQVDFISFHPYEYEKDQVRSEMYWYHKFINKPWIIGETGVPADNDSIPYSAQLAFAKKTYAQERNCNGLGYSWWQFKDISWGDFNQAYLGLVNREGTTTLSTGETVDGTVKDLGKGLKHLMMDYKTEDCICPENHYNLNSHHEYCVKGRVMDNEGNPIEGAAILAWDETYLSHNFTTTKADGTFELYSQFDMVCWMVSALEHEKAVNYLFPTTAKLQGNTITQDLGEFSIKKVNYSPWQRFFRRFSSKRYR
jgi:hypothetical protein